MPMKRCALALVLVFSLVLGGCTAGTPLGGGEPVVLRYFYEGSTPELEAVLDAFESEYPNVTVELIAAVEGGAATIGTEIQNGQIDLIRGGQEYLALAERNLLLPLDDMQLDEWAEIRDDYIPGLWEALAVAGEQYGIPAGVDTLVTFVNQDALLALGEALPGPNDIWDNYAFLDLATRLNYPEGLPGDPSHPLYGFCSNHQELDPFVFVYANGGAIVDDMTNPQRPTLDDPRTVEALEWYVDLFERYAVAPGPEFMGGNYGPAGLRIAQVSGYCGLWFGLLSERGYTGETAWPFQWEMLPVPGAAADLGLALVEGYYFPRGTEHAEYALQLARYLSDNWRAAGGLLPPRRSLVEDPAYAQAIGEQIVAQVSQLESMTVISLDMASNLVQVGMAVLEAVDYAITQHADIAPLLQEAQRRAEQAFGP